MIESPVPSGCGAVAVVIGCRLADAERRCGRRRNRREPSETGLEPGCKPRKRRRPARRGARCAGGCARPAGSIIWATPFISIGSAIVVRDASRPMPHRVVAAAQAEAVEARKRASRLDSASAELLAERGRAPDEAGGAAAPALEEQQLGGAQIAVLVERLGVLRRSSRRIASSTSPRSTASSLSRSSRSRQRRRRRSRGAAAHAS